MLRSQCHFKCGDEGKFKMAESVVSRQEYLQKYLSVDKKKKKRKTKSIPPVKQVRSQIIDDDLNLNNIPPPDVDSEPEYGEEAPLVVEVIDERPKQIITEEEYRKSNKWKLLQGSEDKTSDEKIIDSENNIVDCSVKKRQRHDSDSDYETPTYFTNNSKQDGEFYPKSGHLEEKKLSSDDSSEHRTRSKKAMVGHTSDSDLNPPRDRKNNSDSDLSPTKNRRKNSDSDLSPVRDRRKNSDSDLSPIRNRRKNSDSDLSPIRNRRRNSDSDSSPLRERQNRLSPDLSPRRLPKLRREFSKRNLPKNERISEKIKVKKSKKTSESDQIGTELDKAKSGLQSAKEIKAALLEKDKSFQLNDDEQMGRDAATIFRDKSTGLKRDIKQEARRRREENQTEQAREEKYRQWGKGLKQIEANKQQIDDLKYEMSKPLARYKDDEDLDQFLRSQEREGDPALLFMKRKSTTEENERQKYRGPPPPPNRFGILPGFRWDGVDRSNGFEKERFLRLSNKKATMEENYKWSTEDM